MGKAAIYVRESPSSAINQKKRKRLRSEEQESGHGTEYMHSRRARMTTAENSQRHFSQGRESRDMLRAQPMSTSYPRPMRDTHSKSELNTKERNPLRNPTQKALESPPGNKSSSSDTVDGFLRSLQLLEPKTTRPDEPLEAHEEVTPPKCPSPGVTPTTSSLRSMTCVEVNLGHDRSLPQIVSSLQLNLTYRGYTLTYDMSCLPDNPAVPLALLAATESHLGAYLIVGAHYRRTGRPRAARSILQSLLDKHKSESGPHKGNDHCRSLEYIHGSTFNFPGMRPVLLMLAACELDISHENPTTAESNFHASTAHELFRAIYGSAGNSTWTNSAGNRATLGPVLSDSKPSSPGGQRRDLAAGDSFVLVEGTDSANPERICVLEKELQDARDCQKHLVDDCAAARDSLATMKTEFKLLEGRYEEALRLLAGEQEKRVVQWSMGGGKGLWGTLRNILS